MGYWELFKRVLVEVPEVFEWYLRVRIVDVRDSAHSGVLLGILRSSSYANELSIRRMVLSQGRICHFETRPTTRFVAGLHGVTDDSSPISRNRTSIYLENTRICHEDSHAVNNQHCRVPEVREDAFIVSHLRGQHQDEDCGVPIKRQPTGILLRLLRTGNIECLQHDGYRGGDSLW